MQTFCLTAIVALIWGAGASAQPQPPAATQQADKIPDLCRNAIDPYLSIAERSRFFRAAGVDNELSKEEFAADSKRRRSFVRSFDRWELMIHFDKNANKTLDWFEADRYRREVRRQVLAAFDADRDKKLTGPERDAANKALAAGKLPTTPGEESARIDKEYENELIRKHDTDKDGKLSEEEKRAAFDEMRRQGRKQMLEKYDTDGDGELSRKERRAARRDRQGPWKDTIRRWELRDFDENNNGQIDPDERKAIRAHGEKMKPIGEMFAKRMTDIDGDGEITDEEKEAVGKKWRTGMWKMMTRFSKYMDADGDRQVSFEEMQNFGQRIQPAIVDWMDDYSMRFDIDRDGRLGPRERDAMIKGLYRETDTRLKKFDANGDGWLEPDEMLNLAEDFIKELDLRPDDPPTKPTSPPKP